MSEQSRSWNTVREGVAARQGEDRMFLTDWLRAHAQEQDKLVDAFRAENREAMRDSLVRIAMIAVLAAEWMERHPERW